MSSGAGSLQWKDSHRNLHTGPLSSGHVFSLCVPVVLIHLDDQAGVCVAPLSPDFAKRPAIHAFYVYLLQNLDLNIPLLVSVSLSVSLSVDVI